MSKLSDAGWLHVRCNQEGTLLMFLQQAIISKSIQSPAPPVVEWPGASQSEQVVLVSAIGLQGDCAEHLQTSGSVLLSPLKWSILSVNLSGLRVPGYWLNIILMCL